MLACANKFTYHVVPSTQLQAKVHVYIFKEYWLTQGQGNQSKEKNSSLYI